MKKYFYLVIFFAGLATATTNAQTSAGIKGGVNVATIGGDAVGVDPRIGFHAGFFVSARLSDNFGLQPEIIYSSQGAQAAENSDIKFAYNYINIPLMLKYYPNENLSLQVGPQLGVLTSAKVKFNTEDQDVKDQLENTDVAIGVGLGYENESVNLSVRYNFGMSNTAVDSGSESFPNNVLQLSVGFLFN